MKAGARPMPLRRRVALAFIALGFVLSVASATAVAVVAEDYEYVLAAEILRGQADDYSLRLANGLPAELPRTHRLSGFRPDDVPPRYAGYPLGVHEDPARQDVHVGVFDTSTGRMTFIIDLSDIEQLEEYLHLFLAAMVVLGTALAGWLGWLLAGTALAPVGRLASSVDALTTRPASTTLAGTTSDDELGRLAGALDAYQARLVEADTQQQAFFADASHELRTPVAVVQGALEVMLDEPQPPALAARLHRVERGMGELSDLLEAMLDVARRRPPHLETVDAAAFLHEAGAAALAQAQAHAHAGASRVALEVHAPGSLVLAPREARLLLRGVLRRLLPHATAGTLSLRLDEAVLELAFDAGGAASTASTASAVTGAGDAGATRSDTGAVPALLERLAQRLGWRVEFPSAQRARIALQPPSQTMWTSARA